MKGEREGCSYCGVSAPAAQETIPACRECNSLLRHTDIGSLEGRKAHVSQCLAKKYAKYLAMPEWTEEEISECGLALQAQIRAGLSIRDRTRTRLMWSGGQVPAVRQAEEIEWTQGRCRRCGEESWRTRLVRSAVTDTRIRVCCACDQTVENARDRLASGASLALVMRRRRRSGAGRPKSGGLRPPKCPPQLVESRAFLFSRKRESIP